MTEADKTATVFSTTFLQVCPSCGGDTVEWERAAKAKCPKCGKVKDRYANGPKGAPESVWFREHKGQVVRVHYLFPTTRAIDCEDVGTLVWVDHYTIGVRMFAFQQQGAKLNLVPNPKADVTPIFKHAIRKLEPLGALTDDAPAGA